MKKITFDSMPEALSELIDKVGKLEKMLSGRKSGMSVSKKKPVKKATKAAKAKKTAGVGKDMLNLQQASRLLKLSKTNLYAYVKGKKIPFKKRGNRLYFSKPELEKWNKKKGAVGSKGNAKVADAITVSQAAKLLKISPVTLYYHIKQLRIPVVLKKGRSLYYSKKVLVDAVGSKLRKQPKTKTKTQAKTARPKASAKAVAKKSKPVRAKKARPAKPAIDAKESKPAGEVKATKKTAKAAKPSKGSKPAKAAAKKSRPAKTAAKESKPAETATKESRPSKAAGKPAKAAKKPAKAAKKTAKAKKAKKPATEKQPKPQVEQPVQSESSEPANQPGSQPETPQQEQTTQE